MKQLHRLTWVIVTIQYNTIFLLQYKLLPRELAKNYFNLRNHTNDKYERTRDIYVI